MLKGFLCSYLSQFLPKLTCQKLKLGDVYICSLGDYTTKSNTIFNNIACGANYSWEIALLKAQSEYVERKAFQASKFKSTTGFAAFPFIFRMKKSQEKARYYAYLELVERYVWPEWFYNTNVYYKLRSEVNKVNRGFFQGIQNEIKFLKFYAIFPKLKDDLKVAILYSLTGSGLVCGGAAHQNEEQAEQNALKELYMHAIGLYRLMNYDLQATTTYEKRIAWISKQDQILEKRLTFLGNQAISIPFPVVCQNIKIEINQAYVVQRCFFKGYDKEFISEDNEMYI